MKHLQKQNEKENSIMSAVELKAYKVDKIDFVNSLENGSKIALGNKYSYQVQYANGNNAAKGTFDIEVHDKENPEKFKIHVIVVGLFAYDPNEKKELIHTETFKALFPYAKALVTTVTANCGIQPVIIPNINIDDQQIYRIDNNPSKE